MTQRQVAAFLQESLSAWLDLGELSKELLSGSPEILLSGTRLRQRRLSPAVCLTGRLGRLGAKWSWVSLLKSPVIVEVEDLTLVLQLRRAGQAHEGEGEEEKEEEQKVNADELGEKADQRSWNFTQRLKRRIWDNLQVKISGLHVRMQGPEDTAQDARGGMCAGLVATSLDICPARASASDELRQSVDIKDLGCYVACGLSCLDQHLSLPPEENFVIKRFSPHSWAVRRAGRRFVDVRGLEIFVGLESLQARWTREQLKTLFFLFRCLTRAGSTMAPGVIADALEVPADHESEYATSFVDALEEGFQDVLDENSTVQSARPKWWSRWFSAPAKQPDIGNELPAGISEADRSSLLLEESPPPDTSSFQVTLTLRQACLHAVDSRLLANFSVQSTLAFRSLNQYKGSFELLAFDLLEMPLVCNAELDVPQVPQRCCGRPEGNIEGPQLAVSIDKSSGNLSVSISSAPLDINVSPMVLNSLEWLLSQKDMLVPVTDELSAGTDAPERNDETLVSFHWKAEPIRLWVKPASLSNGQFMLEAVGYGGPDSLSGRTNSTLQLRLAIEDEAGSRNIFEDVSFQICTWDTHLRTLTCEKFALAGEVRDLVAGIHAARDCWQGLISRGVITSTSPTGDATVRPAASSKTTYSVRIARIELELNDRQINALSVIGINSLEAAIDTDICTLKAHQCDLRVSADGIERGLVTVTEPCVSIAFADQSGISFAGQPKWFRTEARIGFDLWDLEQGAVAIHCPSLEVSGSIGVDGVNSASSLKISLTATLRENIKLNTEEEFLVGCRLASDYVLSLAALVFSVKACVFKSRPLGMHVEDAKITAVSGNAHELGITAGSTICGMEPPANDLVEQLQHRPLPIALLVEPPPAHTTAEIVIHPFAIHFERLSAKRALEVAVEESQVAFEAFELHNWQGSLSQLTDEVTRFYMSKVMKHLPALVASLSIAGQKLRDSVAGPAGSSLAMLSLPGAIAGTLAKGVVMASNASAARAMELRRQKEADGGSVNETSGYRFGDITRGLFALASERGPRVRGSYDDREESSSFLATASDGAQEQDSGVTQRDETNTASRSSTAGTAFGGRLLGEGSSVAQAAAERMAQAAAVVQDSVSDTVAKGREARGDQPSGGYRLGDFTRGLVAAGRQSRGSADSGEYKFGDVTRGLFSKLGGGGRR